jgi:flavin-dependent dehydrogenase
MLLARQGYKVLLVDRATFPSEIPHGHFIHRHGPPRLKRWGLLDKIIAAGAPPSATLISDLGDFPLVGTDLIVDGVAWGYGPRRKVLDHILVEAAVAAGAELREGFAVEGFLADGDRITGIRGRSAGGGAPVAERANLTIGADGRHSRLARAVRAPTYEATPAILCYYFSYWSGVPGRSFEMRVRPRERRAMFGFPTNDELYAIFFGWPVEELHRVRADVEGSVNQALRLAPDLAERVACGRRVERFYGAADLPNFFRKPYGPGWALAGDAGCHKDPYLALGICDALRDAELLAGAVDDGLSGSCPLGDSLAEYERRRNEAAMADYQLNVQLARFQPAPEMYRLRAALRGNQADTNRFFLANQGLIPREQFFNPANLERIVGAVPVAA